MTQGQEDYAGRGLRDWIKRVLDRAGDQAGSDIVLNQLTLALATQVGFLCSQMDETEFEASLQKLVKELVECAVTQRERFINGKWEIGRATHNLDS